MKKLTLQPALIKKLDRLKKIDKPVIDLYFRGNDINKIATKPVVAIVGTRKPSMYGIQQTKLIAEELARAGVVVVSGLALGVDALAHSSAFEANGICIAVLPSDVDQIYPATNRILGEKIVASGYGAIISEYESNPRPKKVDFLIRNRIVAALSDAVIVTEAAAQSGTLNTARHAKEMGIPVFALPGNVTSPMSAGCNWLIKNDALIMTEAADVLTHLGLDTSPQQQLDLSTNSPQETLVLQKIALGHVLTDELIQATAIDYSQLQEILTTLEIESRIQQAADGAWHIIR